MLTTILKKPEDFAAWSDAELLAYDQQLTRDMAVSCKAFDLQRVEDLRASSQALKEYLQARAMCFSEILP